jgi:hypothetical protein
MATASPGKVIGRICVNLEREDFSEIEQSISGKIEAMAVSKSGD